MSQSANVQQKDGEISVVNDALISSIVQVAGSLGVLKNIPKNRIYKPWYNGECKKQKVKVALQKCKKSNFGPENYSSFREQKKNLIKN